MEIKYTIVSIADCTFENNTGSAIEAAASKLIFQDSSTFKNNSGFLGEGMQLLHGAYICLKPNTHIPFEDNHADLCGWSHICLK